MFYFRKNIFSKKIGVIIIVSVLAFIIFLSILFYYFFSLKKELPETTKKHALVVLTRGFDNLENYNDLINRNISIYEKYYNLLNETSRNLYDIIIFHEGNITTEQQNYIQSKTPLLPLTFQKIPFYNNGEINNTLCPPNDLSNRFSNGYKNMCHFWSIDFLHYLKDYEYIIRIDEDCIIKNIDIDTIENYQKNNIIFSSAFYQDNDDINVTTGLEKLMNDFLNEHNLTQKNELKMPYTNFMILNVSYFNHNTLVKGVLEKIKKTNCIFSNRWGDLPIWGYILSYLIDKKYYIEDKNIKYNHGSHNTEINL